MYPLATWEPAPLHKPHIQMLHQQVQLVYRGVEVGTPPCVPVTDETRQLEVPAAPPRSAHFNKQTPNFHLAGASESCGLGS